METLVVPGLTRDDRHPEGHPLAVEAQRPPIRSLYIHVPFCSHKCHYCDFYSFVDTRDQQEAFVERLIGELRAIARHAAGERLATVFIGGGTPSLLRLDLWERVLAALGECFDMSAFGERCRGIEVSRCQGEGRDASSISPWAPRHLDTLTPSPEFTVECNPESTTAELCSLLRSGGVNRVSIGAQSFEARHLATLERTHNPENVARAIEFARAAGIERQSIDLIFGVPGQTLEEWDRDLSRAIGLGTTHLSAYALTYEPNTPMTRRLALGEFARADEDLEAEMFELTLARMRGAGLERYEVSNFARPGHESRHNLAYWRQEQWLAVGPSASGHALAAGGGGTREGSWRWKNVPRLGDYLASDGLSPVVDVEAPDPLRFVRERIMMGLRVGEGLAIGPVLEDLGAISADATEKLVSAARRARERRWLTITGERWTLTDAGFLVCDGVAGELMTTVGR